MKHLSGIKEFEGCAFVGVYEAHEYRMGEDYGFPDPPPQRIRVDVLKLVGLKDTSECESFVKQHIQGKFKIFRIQELAVRQETTIHFEAKP